MMVLKVAIIQNDPGKTKIKNMLTTLKKIITMLNLLVLNIVIVSKMAMTLKKTMSQKIIIVIIITLTICKLVNLVR